MGEQDSGSKDKGLAPGIAAAMREVRRTSTGSGQASDRVRSGRLAQGTRQPTQHDNETEESGEEHTASESEPGESSS